MNVSEILNELPKLSENERRMIRRRLLELGAQSEEIEQCNQAALEAAPMLDRMEAD